MSYILDALRKADQERSIGDVPDLATPHWTRRRSGPVRPWVWVVIGLLVINGALLALMFLRNNNADTGLAAPGSVPELAQSTPQTTVEPPLKPLARAERNVITNPRQALPVVETPPVAVAAPRTASVDKGKTPVEKSTAAAVVKPPVVQPTVTEAAQGGGADIPEWDQLSLEFRGSYNRPRLDVHVYDEEPSRRFILVDLKRYVEGDTLEDGAKLEKIMPGSIQLYYQGTRFRLDR